MHDAHVFRLPMLRNAAKAMVGAQMVDMTAAPLVLVSRLSCADVPMGLYGGIISCKMLTFSNFPHRKTLFKPW